MSKNINERKLKNSNKDCRIAKVLFNSYEQSRKKTTICIPTWLKPFYSLTPPPKKKKKQVNALQMNNMPEYLNIQLYVTYHFSYDS